MSEDVVDIWDGVQNTDCWVHDDSSWETDGVVERSAVDIVALAGQAQQSAENASASSESASDSAQSAGGYANAASGYAGSAALSEGAASGYADNASAYAESIISGGYVTSATVSDVVDAAIDAGGYVTSAEVSNVVDDAIASGGFVTSAGASSITSSYVASGGYVTSAWVTSNGYATTAYVDGATADVVHLGGAETISGTKTFLQSVRADNGQIGIAAHSLGYGCNPNGNAGIWDYTRSKWLILNDSGGNTTLADGAVTITSGLTASGGMVVSGGITQIGQALTVQGDNGRASVQVDNDLDGTDEDHCIGLESNSAGNAGIYDFTESSWIIWRDKDGTNRLPGNTFIYSPDNGGTNYHNLSYVPMLDVRDFGAVGDGVTDDYAAIQAALNRAHTTKKMLVIPAGTYLINKHLEFKSDTTVIGYGATILRGYDVDEAGYGSTAWLIRDSVEDPVCRNVRIYGLTFDNNGGTYNTFSQNIVTIGGKTSNGVTESFTASNISFIECTFEKWINYHALDVASTKGLKVLRCIFRGVKYDKSLIDASDESAWKRREAIQFDDSPVVEDYNSDWLIDGNLFEGIDSTFVAPRVGIGQHGGENYVNASYKNIKITNNSFLGCGYAAITLFGVSDSVVSNNYIKDSFYGIEFDSRYSSQNGTLYKIQTNNVVIKGNVFVQQTYNKYSGKNVPFDPGNTSTTYYADCFRFIESHDNVEGAGVDFSAIPFGSDNITITDNSFAGYYVTFRSYGITNTKICGNRISDCFGTFSGAAYATDVSGNHIVNGGYGIRFSPSGWGYAPNDNKASICRDISVKDNAITIADANNFKISTIESSNGYTQVTISGNSVHDDFLYSGSPQTSKYFEIKATSASVITGNVVCAAEKRSTQEVAGTATGNVVRDNDWFVNNVLQ